MQIVATGLPTNVEDYQIALNAALAAGKVLGKAEVGITPEMLYKAARELNRISSEECGVHEEDSWYLYSENFEDDAFRALTAAFN